MCDSWLQHFTVDSLICNSDAGLITVIVRREKPGVWHYRWLPVWVCMCPRCECILLLDVFCACRLPMVSVLFLRLTVRMCVNSIKIKQWRVSLLISSTPLCLPISYLLFHLLLHPPFIISFCSHPLSTPALAVCAPSLSVSFLHLSLLSSVTAPSSLFSLTFPVSVLVCERWVCGVLVIQHPSSRPSTRKPDRRAGRGADKRRPEIELETDSRRLLLQDWQAGEMQLDGRRPETQPGKWSE